MTACDCGTSLASSTSTSRVVFKTLMLAWRSALGRPVFPFSSPRAVEQEFHSSALPAVCEVKENNRRGSPSFTCKLHHACRSFVSVHQMAPPLTEVADIQLQFCYSFIDPEGMKGWVGLEVKWSWSWDRLPAALLCVYSIINWKSSSHRH